MQLILIRGLPGSGKSTIAKALAAAGFRHFENDMYHMRGGEYCFDVANVSAARKWCQRETFKALSNGRNVVVSNTFTLNSDMQPYFDMCWTLGIAPNVIEAKGCWESIHGVPENVIELMRAQWEPLSLTVDENQQEPLKASAPR